MNANEFDLGVTGAGPGGYGCTLRVAHLDLSVSVIESDAVGGPRSNGGCITPESAKGEPTHV